MEKNASTNQQLELIKRKALEVPMPATGRYMPEWQARKYDTLYKAYWYRQQLISEGVSPGDAFMSSMEFAKELGLFYSFPQSFYAAMARMKKTFNLND